MEVSSSGMIETEGKEETGEVVAAVLLKGLDRASKRLGETIELLLKVNEYEFDVKFIARKEEE